MIGRKLSTAPMMGFTDRHCRYLFRLLTPHALLYSEMLTCGALIHGDAPRFLQHHASEHPSAFQLGGSNPDELAVCARMVEDAGFSEVNLNVGCPSDRVQAGQMGACLMKTPHLVADCVDRMQAGVAIPVTVKCRIGVDDNDSYEFFADFVRTVSEGGCSVFVVHARKAFLAGLSAKENRTVPPLRYDYVYRIKREFPALTFILNGGLTSTCQVETVLPSVDGIMVGREAYHNPMFLTELTARLFGAADESPSPFQIADQYLHYIVDEVARVRAKVEQETVLKQAARHLIGLFRGLPGAKEFRRHMGASIFQPSAGIESIRQALRLLDREGYKQC